MKKQIKQTVFLLGHTVYVFWWFLTRPKTRGVKALVVSDSKILLIRQSYGHRKWTFPGGGVGRNESFVDAAKRELKEETGLMVELYYFFEYQQYIEFKDDMVQCFYGKTENPIVVIDGGEIVEFGWFTFEKLPENRSRSVDKIITAYKSTLQIV